MAVSAVTFLAAGCGDEKVVVPKVTGDDSDVFQVYERLSKAGLAVEITDGFRTGPSCECENPIVEQWPSAGTRVERGSAVEVTVGGPGPLGSGGVVAQPQDRSVRLPKLVGQRLDSVDRWLSEHDLGWAADLPRLPAAKGDDLLKDYVVTAQDPGVGSQVDIASAVDLEARPTDDILAQWREATVVVPHVSGEESLPGAYDRLHARGLGATTNQRLAHGPYLPVLAQVPKAGTTVGRGTSVRLILDTTLSHRRVAGDQRRLTMPDLVGRNLGDVSGWLAGRDLYWELVDAPALPPANSARMLDPYVVTSQKPAPGATIPQSIPPGSGDELKPIQLRAKLVAR